MHHSFRCLTTVGFICTFIAGMDMKVQEIYGSYADPGQRFLYMYPWNNYGQTYNNGWKGRRFSTWDIQPSTLLKVAPALNEASKSGFSPPEVSQPKYCGSSIGDPFSDRIVGGREAIPHEFPWMVKVFHDRSFHCGGVLIADRYVLTAGHCVSSHIEGASTEPRSIRGPYVVNLQIKEPREYIVELGSHRLKEKASNVVRRKVTQIMLHPDYDVFASSDIMLQTNDIAILKMPPVAFSSRILPICLPLRNARVRDRAHLVVAGWGSTLTETLLEARTKLPEVLQKTVLTKISFSVCRDNPYVGVHLTPINNMTETQIFCMMGQNEDSCRGDSGGPAVMKTPNGYVVAGLVSWGLGCNQKNYPAAYTQLSSYMDFVLDKTRDGKFLPHVP